MKALALIGLAACANGRAEPPPTARHAPDPSALAPAALCATRGAIRERAVDDAVFRAVAPGTDGDGATLAFTVRGPTAETVALASGQRRRQLGLKLRAADGCNLVYVMWRTEPKAALVVSTKENPGQHVHAACGVRGYRDATPTTAIAPPALVAGAPHTLRAAIDGDTLTAWIDDREVWRGELDAGARALHGPAGVRSDNLAWDGELRAATTGAPAAGCGRDDAD
jgi:hypothetical protein